MSFTDGCGGKFDFHQGTFCIFSSEQARSQQFVPLTVSENQLDFEFLKCEPFSDGHGKSYNLLGHKVKVTF